MNESNLKEILTNAWKRAEALDAPLNERMALYVSETRKVLPNLIASYDEFVSSLRTLDAGMSCPAVGEVLPEFILPNTDGSLVQLSKLLKWGPLVISFNRGHWCPYCKMELRTLARKEPELADIGAKIVSIVPEISEFSEKMKGLNELPFEILTDMDLEYSDSIGLATVVPDNIREFYIQSGINLPVYQGVKRWVLPIPATIVVGQDGIVRARFVDPDFRCRMEISDIKAGVNAS